MGGFNITRELGSGLGPAVQSVVETVGLTKQYLLGVVPVLSLDNVSMKIAAGELVVILGPSGSGKSTLLNMLGALDKPTRGKVLIDGVDVSTLDSLEMARLRLRKIGFVFQFFNLIPRLTALENVEFPLIAAGVGRRERRDVALGLLASVGLQGRVDHRPSELSGGEQQRVAIARSLVNDPKIVLMDEPTGNLDSKTSAETKALVERLNREKGQTFIVVTHNPVFRESADHIIYLLDGRIDREEFRGERT